MQVTPNQDFDTLVMGGKEFHSRLFVGTGKFSSGEVMKKAVEASQSEIVTVALRRVNLENPEDDIISNIDRNKVLLLPNTSGARDATEAVRLARITRSISGSDWLKLEVIPDPVYLLPDPIETLKAAEELVKDGFKVMPYINADPVLCKRLEEVGCVCVMPLGSPIGSNRGIKTKANIEIIIAQSKVPVVIDAGIGQPSHASEAMEMGASAVLVNTAIATAGDPIAIAEAFRFATIAGRLSYLYGVKKHSGTHLFTASASSPLTGFLEEEKR
jgi:thiazole synthase